MHVPKRDFENETGTHKSFDVKHDGNFDSSSFRSPAVDVRLGSSSSAGEGAKSPSDLVLSKHTPSESAVSFVVRALDSETTQIFGSIALTGKVPQRAIKFYMDSGANETMIKEKENC